MASLQKKISSKSKQEQPSGTDATFGRSLVYSALFHGSLMLCLLGFIKFDISFWKKPLPVTTVVWTQTVKRPKPTIPDKLPPPLVPLEKPEEPKKEEINVKKTDTKPEKEISAKDKMKKALEELQKKVAPDDDRPIPKENNFPTQDPKAPEGTLTDAQIAAIQATSAYGAYESMIKKTVTDNFIWYKTGTNFVTTVSIKIDASGNILNAKIIKSSGDPSYDQATLRAIHKSSPLPPPVADVARMLMQEEIEFRFERKI